MKKFLDTKYGDLRGQVYNGMINVYGEELTSLEGAPKKVKGSFDCSSNNLIDLEGAPDVVEGDFWCCNNLKIKTLKGFPKRVQGSFYCYGNSKVRSLKGAYTFEEIFNLYFEENMDMLQLCIHEYSEENLMIKILNHMKKQKTNINISWEQFKKLYKFW